MPPFKDENIFIIAPGSQTTLAQLGLPESFTPASHRFPTRMFQAPDGKTFEPYKIISRKKEKVEGTDTAMGGTTDGELQEVEEEEELVEYPEDDEGAIWPLKGTRFQSPTLAAYVLTSCRGSNRQHASLLRLPSIYSRHFLPWTTYANYADCATGLDRKRSRGPYTIHVRKV